MRSTLVILTWLSHLSSGTLLQPGLQFSATADGLPVLTLPYGRFQATEYDANKDIYTFANIRYAAPPVNELRWQRPQPPAYSATLSTGDYGPMCIQGKPTGVNLLGPLNQLGTVAGIVNGLVDGIIPLSTNSTNESEDCLFLDLYVPGSAVRSPSTSALSVVVWIYGGAYIFGAKDELKPLLPLYSGKGPIQESGNQIVFVTLNYRLGSYGFLAGTTMEQQGQPNAGFYDQRAALQWVQDYIHLVGGNKSRVTAWGESAGAGSILHHLTAFGGSQDPLFSKAVLQSIASEILVDRTGDLQRSFDFFADKAGCSGQGLACLRAATPATLKAANDALIATPPSGAFGPGPAADGAWLRQMPALELATGNYWKKMDGLILSHVSSEATLFVTGAIDTDAKFKQLVDFVIPDYAAEVLQDVQDFFPSPSQAKNYSTETSRTEAWLKNSNFVCNYRYLTNAFRGKTWNVQYSVTPGYHATDLLPTFFNPSFDLSLFNKSTEVPLIPLYGGLSLAYQSYLTSFSITGNPNTRRRALNIPPAIAWPHPTGIDAEYLTQVLNVGNTGYSLVTDDQALKSNCDFFFDVQAAITSKGGFAPPGAVASNSLGVSSDGDPSRNYVTPGI